MARNRNRSGSFKHQISKALKSKSLMDVKEEKKSNYSWEEQKKWIFSWETYKTYQKQLIIFSDYIKENFQECKTLEQITPEIVNNYLQFHINKNHSPYTLTTIKSAVAKVTKYEVKDFMKTPARERQGITRGREKINPETGEIIEKNKSFNREKHKDLIEFLKGTGLRKSEVKQVRGSDLKKENGKYYLNITKNTKGGRHREVEIVGNIEKIVEMAKNAGTEKIFQKFPNECPVHNYRSEYCRTIYNKYKRHHQTISKLKREGSKELYYCKKDKAGVIYDKKAMKIASECLGHSRIDVIAINYLH